MLDDLTERVQSSQNKLDSLVSRIPGYAGYKAKEQRREADKLLRLHVAAQYQEQMNRLNEMQYALTSGGQLRLILVLERAVMKLQLLIDRIKTASYGYAGLFDAVKVDEEVLDRLYDFDESMLDGADELATLLSNLQDAAASDALSLADGNQLVGLLEELNNTFSHRQDVVLA